MTNIQTWFSSHIDGYEPEFDKIEVEVKKALTADGWPFSDGVEREMPQSPDANREIAQILGYTVYHYDKGPTGSAYYQLWDGGGEAVNPGPAGERRTEEKAWTDVPDFAQDEGFLEVKAFLRAKSVGLERLVAWYYALTACREPWELMFDQSPTCLSLAILGLLREIVAETPIVAGDLAWYDTFEVKVLLVENATYIIEKLGLSGCFKGAIMRVPKEEVRRKI